MKDVWRGVRRHPWRTAGKAFLAFSVIWTLTEASTYFVPGFKFQGLVPLAIIVVIGVAYALWDVSKPSKVEIHIAHTNTTLEILFGDFFDQHGYRAIAVNEFFDSELGKPVSETSLHGKFLMKCFGGHPAPFDKQVTNQLAAISDCEEIDRLIGRTKKYPIGTCVRVNANNVNYLCFVLCRTDPNTCKASADVSMLWDALQGLWHKARIETGGEDLTLPLVGSGLSGVGLPTRDLLNLIILSVVTETKQQQITGCVRIVLGKDRFDDIDLREIKQYWGAA